MRHCIAVDDVDHRTSKVKTVINCHDAMFSCSPKVKTLAKALSPCYLRVGGTSADFLQFSLKSNPNRQYDQSEIFFTDRKHLSNFTMYANQWDALNHFVSKVGWDLIFDLNSLLRNNGQWSTDNAELLLNYTATKGYKVAGWELGNEPNAYKHEVGYTVSAKQRAEDYIKLNNLLKQYPQWSDSVVIGPSTTQLDKKKADKYLQKFLQMGGAHIVTNPTFHHYYVDGRETSVEQFMDPEILDSLSPEIMTAYAIAKHGKVWLGETSSAYGGGAPGLSDRYVAGFMWLDKLGLSAKLGIDVVVRQDFYGGHYSLIDSKTLDPNPDFWLSYLFDTLVGQNVLNTTVEDKSGYVRLYAHCTNSKRSKYLPGSLTFYGMNLKVEPTTVLFSQFPRDMELHVYILQPVGEHQLKSKSVSLNGRILELNSDYSLPGLLTPVIQRSNVTFPPQSFGFVVLPQSKSSVCQ